MDNLEQILKVLFRRVSAKSVLNGCVDGGKNQTIFVYSL